MPGSFDPITNGHLDVIRRARAIFDEVVVAVGANSSKTYLFPPDERLELVRAATADLDGVRAEPLSGLLVDFCRSHGADAIVKGGRAGGDFEFEVGMARMNHSMTGVETVILPASAQWSFVSSTLVREVARLGGDAAPYVPDVVAARLAMRRAHD
ncbi:MAG TPA: pantetheine-phosphate adenylyltransferase [Propionibacteriaceae bacterium]|nr:pantetheine-phosphate adenylyltransferase [Propionibacteriaceae bacterium]